MESNVVLNFVRNRTPFGRGYDHEIEGLGLKAKGVLVSSALENKYMITAVQKHAPDRASLI